MDILQVKFSWKNSANYGTSNSIIIVNPESGISISEFRLKQLIEEKAKSTSVYDSDFEVEKIIEIKPHIVTDSFVFIGGF